jgi:hypothetical protein
MTSEAIRDRIACEPISTDPSQAEGIAEFASRDMKLQTATPRYKREPRQACICHDDVYAVGSLENDPMKLPGRVKVGQPGTVERGAR